MPGKSDPENGEVVKKIITTETYVAKVGEEEERTEEQTEESAAGSFMDFSAYLNIAKEFNLKELSEPTKKMLDQVKHYAKVSNLMVEKIPRISLNNFAIEASLIKSQVEKLSPEMLNEAYDLPADEQALILASFFEVIANMFAATEKVMQKEDPAWFSNITNTLVDLFGSAQKKKMNLVDAKDQFSQNVSAWLALTTLLSKSAKRRNKEKAKRLKMQCSQIKRFLKEHPDRDFASSILSSTKSMVASHSKKDLHSFLEKEILPIMKKSDELMQKCDEVFVTTFSEIKSSVQKFKLPAMKMVLTFEPMYRMTEALNNLEKMIYERLGGESAAYIVSNIKDQFSVYDNNVKRAKRILEVANREDCLLDDTTISNLNKLGNTIQNASIQSQKFIMTVENALKVAKITEMVNILSENLVANEGFVENYFAWWREFEAVNFKDVGSGIGNVLKA